MPAFSKTLASGVPLGTDFASTIDDTLADYNTAIKERLGLEHYDLAGDGDDTPAVSDSDTAAVNAQGRHIPGKVSAVYIATASAIEAIGSSHADAPNKGSLAWASDTGVMYIGLANHTYGTIDAETAQTIKPIAEVDTEGFYNTAVVFNSSSDAVQNWQGPTDTRLFLTGWFLNQHDVPDEPWVELHINNQGISEDDGSGARRRIARVVNMTSKSEMQFCGIIPKGAWWSLNTNITQATSAGANYYETLPI